MRTGSKSLRVMAIGPVGAGKSTLLARFALSMRAPIVGVVSKIDIATPENILRAEKTLAQGGVRKIFRVSSITGEGIPELESYLETDRH